MTWRQIQKQLQDMNELTLDDEATIFIPNEDTINYGGDSAASVEEVSIRKVTEKMAIDFDLHKNDIILVIS